MGDLISWVEILVNLRNSSTINFNFVESSDSILLSTNITSFGLMVWEITESRQRLIISNRLNTGITIVQIALKSAYEAQNKNDWRIKPGIIITKFGQPIEKKDFEKMKIDQLSLKVKKEIQKMIDS